MWNVAEMSTSLPDGSSNKIVDITITAANEYGQSATQKILGVEILNSGAGLSVDDITNEQQVTFVARSITKWQPVQADTQNALSEASRLEAATFVGNVATVSV